jgi:transposase
MGQLIVDRLYALTEEQCTPINRVWLPPEESGRGRPPQMDNHHILQGVRHMLRMSTPWRDVPQVY